MNKRLEEDVLTLPTKPGVYQMFDENGEIIYIGKAKNLKNRVSQYFLRPQNGKTQAMVSHVDHFELIITKSEKEALILEMNLIQKYLPRYNILLKDDKHYPYIAIHKVKDPYISIARNVKSKNCEYFGPYPISSSAYQTIDLLNKIYPLRKCTTLKNTPCLYYHLNQCLAPCIKEVAQEDYDKILNSIRKFLKGENKEITDEIIKKINEASENLDFESAGEFKKYLDAINHINDRQNVELIDNIDRDIFAYTYKETYVSLSIFIYRKGLLIGKRNFTYQVVGELEDFIVDLICQYYSFNKIPTEIILGNNQISTKLTDFLNIKVNVPTKGKLFELLTLVKENSEKDLEEHFISSRINDDNVQLLEELGRILNIKTPYNIELFDNSHLQGTNAIGAMVSFVNGETFKNNYRKFNIESYNKSDDLLMMKEVIYRRYKKLKDENLKFPDLIIVDGGLLQLKSAKEVLDSLNLNIEVVGLVKNDKHRTSGLIDINEKEYYFDDNKPIFYLLTRMQDEVHRYAISTHRNKRNKAMYSSIFDDIKGLGNKRKELLIKLYPTINDLKNVTLIELEQILPKEIASNLYNKIRG